MANREQPILEKLLHQKNLSKKRKFVNDGVFHAELNEFLSRVLGEDGFAGCEIRVTPIRTEIIVRATRTREVVGDKARRIRELTSLVEKRFGFRQNRVELFAEQIKNRGCNALAQAESLRFKLLGGLAVRRACYGVLNYVMKNGANGVEVVVSGVLRAQRAKSMKFRDGYLISTGEPKNHYIVEACRHVMMKQGVLGVKVKIMLKYDKEGKEGTSYPPVDVCTVLDPKEDVIPTQPTTDHMAAVEQQLEEMPVIAEAGVEQVAQEYQGTQEVEASW